MSNTPQPAKDAQSVFQTAINQADRLPNRSQITFVCPWCKALCQQHVGIVNMMQLRAGGASGIHQLQNNLGLSECVGCRRTSLFNQGLLVWPLAVGNAPEPNPDMPPELIKDFAEARSIYLKSPRGASALLRLVVQKLCPHLGAKSPKIDTAIGELVANGTISVLIQQALDSVRVIGNEAVHPGTLDLEDDTTTVLALFGLINVIVDKAISEPARVAAIYGTLPPSKLSGIADRDKKKALKPPSASEEK